jgi:PST family polysaccharide transporter
LVGGASAINIFVGIIKVKFLALALGPTGVGLMGIYQNLMRMATTISGCGLENSGVRQIAASADAEERFAATRRALWVGSIFLGTLGMTALWLFRSKISLWVFDSADKETEIGWLGLGVLLALIAGSRMALLRGVRRYADIAWITIVGALVSAVVGIAMVSQFGEGGLVWFVISVPAVTALVSAHYVSKLPRLYPSADWESLRNQWLSMIRLGFPFMAATVMALMTQLAVRSIVLRELGIDDAGFFQAAWAISVTYIGVVLAAMGTDYYPRLTAKINDHATAKKLANEQTEVAVLLAGPMLLAMIILAPWVIRLLYASEFEPSAAVLRWQVIGDVLKVASWPMGFILLAKGRGPIYFICEFSWNASYLFFVIIGVPLLGLMATGVGFAFAYGIYFVVLLRATHKIADFRPTTRNLLHMLAVLIACVLILLLANSAQQWTLALGAPLVLSAIAYSLWRLNSLVDLKSFVR